MSPQAAPSRSTPFVIATRPRTPAKLSGTARLRKSGKLKPDPPQNPRTAGVIAGDTAKVWQPGTAQPAAFRRVLSVADDAMTNEPAGFSGPCRFRVPVEWPPSGLKTYIAPLPGTSQRNNEQQPAWQRLQLVEVGVKTNIARLDGRDYRIGGHALELLRTLQAKRGDVILANILAAFGPTRSGLDSPLNFRPSSTDPQARGTPATA